jgi:peroxin-19
MKAIWEAMLVEGMDGGASGGVGDGKGMDVGGMQLGEEFKGSSKPGGDKKPQETGKDQSDFQKTIRATMDKLKGSESNLQSNPESASDPLSALLAQLSSLKLDDTGTNSPPNEEEEAELQGLLENMMGQLMSKDVLGDPLTELSEKFPAYLEENKSTLSPDDLKRYESQMECVAKIVAVFKDPNYKDDDPEWNTKIVNLMTEMQSHGSPPAEIMGPLPPGFGIGQDGMPEGCVVG